MAQIQIKQSVRMKRPHNDNKALTFLLKADLRLSGPAERQHSKYTPDERNPLSPFVKGSDRPRPLQTHTHTHTHTCTGK